jgi:hypothetical protein
MAEHISTDKLKRFEDMSKPEVYHG